MTNETVFDPIINMIRTVMTAIKTYVNDSAPFVSRSRFNRLKSQEQTIFNKHMNEVAINRSMTTTIDRLMNVYTPPIVVSDFYTIDSRVQDDPCNASKFFQFRLIPKQIGFNIMLSNIEAYAVIRGDSHLRTILINNVIKANNRAISDMVEQLLIAIGDEL